MSSLSVPAQAFTHEWATHIRLTPARPGGLCAGLSPCRSAHCHPFPAGCTFHGNSSMQEHLLSAPVTALLSHTARTIRGAWELSENTRTYTECSGTPLVSWQISQWQPQLLKEASPSASLGWHQPQSSLTGGTLLLEGPCCPSSGGSMSTSQPSEGTGS